MKIEFPKSTELEWRGAIAHPGRVGMVEAAHGVLEHHGAEFDLDELMVASSAAFANYVYHPDLNGHEDDRRLYSPYSIYFSNYGIFESLSHYTGWEFGELNGLSQKDLKKLLMFEIADGRPIMSFGVGGLHHPQVIYGYEREGLDFRLQIRALDEDLEHHLKEEELQVMDEVFVNYAVIVRADDREWYLPPARQRLALLRWAIRHWTSSKEFFHETRENYAPGIFGVEAFGNLLREFSNADEWGFAGEHVAATRRGRVAMQKVLERWAEPVGRELGSTEVTETLANVSEKAGEVAEALAAFELSKPEDWDSIAELEQAWVDELTKVRDYLPSPFG